MAYMSEYLFYGDDESGEEDIIMLELIDPDPSFEVNAGAYIRSRVDERSITAEM